MSNAVAQLLQEVFEIAALNYVVTYSSNTAGWPRVLWPTELLVDDLALVEIGASDLRTKICALGVGSYYCNAVWGKPTGFEKAAQEYILPRAQWQLRNRGYSSSYNYTEVKDGIIGNFDLVIHQLATVELMITRVDSPPTISPEKSFRTALLSWIKSLPVYIVVIPLETLHPSVFLVSAKSTTAYYKQALRTVSSYQKAIERSPLPVPYGNCSICLFHTICPMDEMYQDSSKLTVVEAHT